MSYKSCSFTKYVFKLKLILSRLVPFVSYKGLRWYAAEGLPVKIEPKYSV